MSTLRNEPWRPGLHFTPARHWINDPNGLVWFDGEYHLFYQLNPFGDQWGHMSWGHAVSTDLVNWQELDVAIPEDARESVFSGSVVVDTHNSSGFGDGVHPPLVAIYTACLRRPEGGQQQCLAFSTDRGRTWTRHAGNPVLDLGVRDFRDPKVFWHAPSARWVMVVAHAADLHAAFYASANLKDWTLLSHFGPVDHGGAPVPRAQARGQLWECPDLIALPLHAADGRPERGADGQPRQVWMLKVDLFEDHPSGGTGARLFFGQFDGQRFMPDPAIPAQWADHGSDFYAALSWAHLPAGAPQPLWIGWMSCHRYAKLLPTAPWRGAMGLPRALRLQRGVDGVPRLHQQVPAACAQQLAEAPLWQQPLQLADGQRQALASGPAAERLLIELEISALGSATLTLRLREGTAQGDAPAELTRVGVDGARGVVFVDRSQAGFAPEGDALWPGRREAACAMPAPGRPLTLQLWLDSSSVELLADDGAVSITELILPAALSTGVSVEARGGAVAVAALQVRPLRAARFSGEAAPITEVAPA